MKGKITQLTINIKEDYRNTYDVFYSIVDIMREKECHTFCDLYGKWLVRENEPHCSDSLYKFCNIYFQYLRKKRHLGTKLKDFIFDEKPMKFYQQEYVKSIYTTYPFKYLISSDIYCDLSNINNIFKRNSTLVRKKVTFV